MKSCRWIGIVGLCLVASAAYGEGLITDSRSVPWPQWQGRLSIGTAGVQTDTAAAPFGELKIQRASLLGDYYFARSVEPTGRASGFRATSGLMFGPAAQLGIAPPVMPVPGGAFNTRRHDWGLMAPGVPGSNADTATVPYVGIGYSEISPKGGWGFSADFGLLARNGSSVKFGQASAGSQNLDDLLRDMRLSPLLQIGVSYSF